MCGRRAAASWACIAFHSLSPNNLSQGSPTPGSALTCSNANKSLRAPALLHTCAQGMVCTPHLPSSLAVQQDALGSGCQQVRLRRPFNDGPNVLRSQQPRLTETASPRLCFVTDILCG